MTLTPDEAVKLAEAIESVSPSDLEYRPEMYLRHLQALARYVLSRPREERTPGTVEICNYCGQTVATVLKKSNRYCNKEECPIHRPTAAAPVPQGVETEDEISTGESALSALEGMADAWAESINLNGMVENVVSPMNLDASASQDIRAGFVKRAKEAIDALIRQAWIEGAYTGRTSHKRYPPASPAPGGVTEWPTREDVYERILPHVLRWDQDENYTMYNIADAILALFPTLTLAPTAGMEKWEPLKILAIALQKFAPDLMEELANRYQNGRDPKALEDFLVYLRKDQY